MSGAAYSSSTLGICVGSPSIDCKTVRIFAYSSTRETLTPRFTDFFTDFEEKTDCFAV